MASPGQLPVQDGSSRVKSSRFTLLFERFAIDVLLATQTVTGAMGILGISWDQTWHILTRAVKRGQSRKVKKLMPRLGIDEKAFKKGQSYMTMLFDLDNSTVRDGHECCLCESHQSLDPNG